MRVSRVERPEYVLELTQDQLVALGILAYRHEDVRGTSGGGFWKNLPDHIRIMAQNNAPVDREKTTDLKVNWSRHD